MILDGTIANADISSTAEIAVSKLANGTARQLLQTDAAGTGVEFTSNVDIPGTLDVTGAVQRLTAPPTLQVVGNTFNATSSLKVQPLMRLRRLSPLLIQQQTGRSRCLMQRPLLLVLLLLRALRRHSVERLFL